VGMYEKQALVLVNRGGATGRDVGALMQAVQAAVQEKFGVPLKPEPVFLGWLERLSNGDLHGACPASQ
jgi:UDP-N-acetylmuramate dehydrogenase